MDSGYLLKVKTRVLDGRIFITGKVDTVEEKLKLTKLAWETDGVRSVRNDIKIKESFNFNPSTPYAVSRAAGDMMAKLWHENFNFPVIFTRAANIYGEGQQLYRIIPKTILSVSLF